MVFSSISFLILFLPITFIGYYLIPNLKIKNGLLLLTSLLFYALGEPVYIILLIISCICNYFFALLIANKKYLDYKKIILIVAIVFNLGLLFFYKYSNFAISILNDVGVPIPSINIILPIGISFYTFQILSYVIDVYRNKHLVQKNFFNLTLYISFFPQLIAGPIVKYHDIDKQLTHRTFDIESIAFGLRRFIFGLSKKVLLSNALASIVDQIYGFSNNELNIVVTWIAAILYCLQIYYDFSGYSDMAIGLGKMFGFHFEENFNYPYISTSIKEFWRRWHISLSSWFKEYLYIPLGGNRKGKNRTIINKCIVFFATGFWHGANYTFVLWGLFNGLFSSLEEKGTWSKKIEGKLIGWLYATVVTIFAFVLFRSNDLTQAFSFYKNMFIGFDIHTVSTSLTMLNFNYYTIFIVVLSCIGVVNWNARISNQKWMSYGKYAISTICLVLCIMSLASNSYNPFIYFRF